MKLKSRLSGRQVRHLSWSGPPAFSKIDLVSKGMLTLSGSIYYHFLTKEEMLHEVIRDALFRMRDNTARIAGSNSNAEHKMIAFILLSLQEMISDQHAHAILYNERKLFRRRPEFDYVAEAKSDMFSIWARVLREGVEAGLFKPDTDVFLTISTVLRMLNTCVDWFRHGDGVSNEMHRHNFHEVVDFNLDFILSALRDPARVGAPIPRAKCEELAYA
ncbi:MAG TPA: TetR/AcrR family transcriptional regulator [Caulobacteraceae bacterium]|nr:TetR/AcrR family transcriptional regulator [Caulobacteraceae bacterium]